MQIVNESDRDVTWWCYNSEDWGREHTSPGGRGDLAQGERTSFNPPNNATGLYYVVFTEKGGSLHLRMVEARKRFHFETQPEARSGPDGNLEGIVQIRSRQPRRRQRTSWHLL